MVYVLFRGIENVVVIHEANDATFSSDVRTTSPEGVRVSAVGENRGSSRLGMYFAASLNASLIPLITR